MESDSALARLFPDLPETVEAHISWAAETRLERRRLYVLRLVDGFGYSDSAAGMLVDVFERLEELPEDENMRTLLPAGMSEQAFIEGMNRVGEIAVQVRNACRRIRSERLPMSAAKLRFPRRSAK